MVEMKDSLLPISSMSTLNTWHEATWDAYNSEDVREKARRINNNDDKEI